MEVIPVSRWHPTHTNLGKYLLARLVQITDSREVITYRHSSTNGLILLDELYDVATLTLTRPAARSSLHKLIDECFSTDSRGSLVNDTIIGKYFRPAREELSKSQTIGDDDKSVLHLQRNALTFATTIRATYVDKLIQELKSVNLNSDHFDTEASRIDELVGLLVPQLLYEGYSLAFVFHATKSSVLRSAPAIISSMLRYYSEVDELPFVYFVPANLNKDFAREMRASRKSLDESQFTGTPPSKRSGYVFTARGKDRFAALRAGSTEAFRSLSLVNPDLSPDVLSAVAREPFFRSRDRFKSMSAEIRDDPISVAFRSNTLQTTLEQVGKSLEDVDRAVLRDVEESLYFYHAGRAAPSLENSYILLWTALEAAMGMRWGGSGISTFSHNVSQAVAMGAVGRRAVATARRLTKAIDLNRWTLDLPKDSPYKPEGLARWIEWLADRSTEGSSQDPFEVLKADPLLCRQFVSLNLSWATLGDLRDVTLRAERNLAFQVERLYLVRNRIVHSGQFGRTGMYLWVHLEYYVGKLLAQGMLVLSQSRGELRADSRDLIFAGLLGQYQSTLDYLDRHRDKPVSAPDVLWSGLTRFPALCF